MAASDPRRSEEPPPIDIDDRGVRWHHEGPVLTIERGPSLLAVAVPVGVLLLIIALAFGAWRRGETGMAILFGVFTVLPLGLIAARIFTRFRIEVDGSGMRWTQTRPVPFYGDWPRADLEGLRYWVDPEAGSWGSRRHARVDIRVRGSWYTFASGLSKSRAHRLVQALALATGHPPEYAGVARPV